MRDEYAVASCPHCGAEVRYPIYSWTASKVNNVGEQEFIPELGKPKCKKGCSLSEQDIKFLEIEDYRWEDW